MNKLFSILLAILMITGLPALGGTAIGTITDAQAHPLPNTKVIVTSFSIPRSHSSGTAVQSKFSVFSDTNGVVTITNAVAGKYQLQPVGANLLQFSFYMPETNGTIYMEDHLVADAGNTLPPDTMSYGVTASDRRYAMLGSSVATNVIVYLFLETNLPVTSAWITNIVSPTLVKVYRGTNTLATWSGNAVTATSVTGSFSGDMTGTQGATVITGLGAERLAMIQTNLNTLITATNLTQAERAALIATNTILVNAIAAERAALIATNNNLAGQIIAATNTPVITRFSTNVVTDVTISGGTINKSTNASGIAIALTVPGVGAATNIIHYTFLDTNLPITSAWITQVVSAVQVNVFKGTNTTGQWDGNAVTATSATTATTAATATAAATAALATTATTAATASQISGLGDSLAVTNLVKAQGTASTNDTIARIAALNLGSASTTSSNSFLRSGSGGMLDASLQTNLNASQISTGTIPLPVLPPSVVTNNGVQDITTANGNIIAGGSGSIFTTGGGSIHAAAGNITTTVGNIQVGNGVFIGNGSGITNLDASKLTGSIPPATLPATITNVMGYTNQSHILYVDKLGTDATAVRGDIKKPFLTAAAATSVATNGDLLNFGIGSFTLTTITNGVSVHGQGIGLTTIGVINNVNTNTSIANCSVSLIGGVPGVYEHNFRADNISIGTLNDIDCFRFTGATNVVVNNSWLYGNWDIDANVISGTWNNDQIYMADTLSGTISFGMHAHYIENDNSTVIVNGGLVSIISTRPQSYYIPAGAFNALFACSATNFTNVCIRVYGMTYNHSETAGAMPINLMYGFGTNDWIRTNVFMQFVDNGVQTIVNGTNIYRGIDTNGNIIATSFTGNGAGLTSLNASALTSGTVPLAVIPTSVATNLVNGIAQTFPLSALANDGGNPKNTIMIGSLPYNYGCIGWDFGYNTSIIFPVDWRPFIPSILNGATNFYVSIPVFTTNKNMSIAINPICFIETNALDGISPNGYINITYSTNFSFTGPGTNFYRLNLKWSIPKGLLTNAAMISFGGYNASATTNFAIPSYGGSISNWTQ